MDPLSIFALIICGLLVIALIGYIVYYFVYKNTPPISPLRAGYQAAGVSGTPSGPGACVPPDNVWSIPNGGSQGRSLLASSCCQPPNYELYDPSYKSCDNADSEPDLAIRACLKQACKYCDSEAANMDPSWYNMCKCGSALCCYNSQPNSNTCHFSKYGTCVHYLQGDLAEAQTSDSCDYISF